MLDDPILAADLAVARDLIQRPPPVPKQAAGFSAWKTTTAAPRGVVAGGAQSGGFFADTLAAFGQALGGTGTASAQGMFSTQTDAERQQSEQQAQKIRAEGLDFSSATGDNLRGFARFLAPDPETAHTAERLVFDLSRVMTKAVGYSVAGGGPLAGAVLTGADEGMTAADDLKQAGVDLGTRTKAGAVIGLATGAGVALPVAGNTLGQTVGLVATGGPLSFMAQQQAVRSILQAADYSKLAEQYDPLDPVGLAVSTLIPAGFGAWGLRAAKVRAANAGGGPTPESTLGGRQPIDFQQNTAGDSAVSGLDGPGRETAIARAAREATQEHIDAARVMLDAEQRRSTNPLGEDARAADAHEAAMSKAIDQIARGERVAVDDVAPRITAEVRDANFKAWFGDSKVVDGAGKPKVMYHGTRSDVQQFSAAKLGEATGADSAQLGFFFTDTVSGEPAGWMARGAEVWAADREGSYSGGGNVMPVYVSMKNPYRATPAEMGRAHSSADAALALRQKAEAAGHDGISYKDGAEQWYIAFQPGQVKSAIGNSGRFDPNSASLTDSPIGDFAQRIADAGRAIESELPKPPAPKEPPRAAEPAAPKPPAAEPAPSAAATPARAAPAAAGADGARPPAANAKAGLVEDAAAAARVEQVKAEAPDLMVQLDGMDAPMRVDELLAAVKAEADDMVLDAELMQVAAECALRMGA